MISGLNHITIAVSDLETSFHFYTEILGLKGHVKWENGAYLSADDLWFCLSVDQVDPKEDYTHIAFTISESEYSSYCDRLRQHKVVEWKVNKSEGLSFYFLDPDGHKLEIHVGSLEDRLQSLKVQPYQGLKWL